MDQIATTAADQSDTRTAGASAAPFVRVANDADGRVIVALDPAAADALHLFLDSIDVFDWVQDDSIGGDSRYAAAAVVSTVRDALFKAQPSRH